MKRLCLMLAVAMLSVAIPLTALGQCGPGGCPLPETDYGGWKAATPQLVQPQESYFKSVVRIRGDTRGRSQYYGSGCAVQWGDKVVILTASHVIRGVTKVSARGKSGYQVCKVLRSNKAWDVAVLEPTNPSDFDTVAMAYGSDGPLRVGDNLESCGFGDNDKLKVNRGQLRRFNGSTGDRSAADWLVMSGFSRQGDSGGPVFRNGKLVGVLWGTDGSTTQATQVGRLHLIVRKAIGKPITVQARDRTIVGVNTGLFDRGILGCNPRQQPANPPTPPLVSVQADPRVGDALVGISGKLDQVIVNTTPLEEDVVGEKEEDANPGVLVLIIAIGLVLAAVMFYKNNPGV